MVRGRAQAKKQSKKTGNKNQSKKQSNFNNKTDDSIEKDFSGNNSKPISSTFINSSKEQSSGQVTSNESNKEANISKEKSQSEEQPSTSKALKEKIIQEKKNKKTKSKPGVTNKDYTDVEKLMEKLHTSDENQSNVEELEDNITTTSNQSDAIESRVSEESNKQNDDDDESSEWEELETNNLQKQKTQRRRQSTYTARKSSKKAKKPFRLMTPHEREVMFLKDVVRLQSMRQPMIPKAAFMRLVRELVLDTGRAERISDKAFEALQIAAETHITQLLQDSYMLTMHRTRITLQVKDLRLLLVLRTRSDGLFV